MYIKKEYLAKLHKEIEKLKDEKYLKTQVIDFLKSKGDNSKFEVVELKSWILEKLFKNEPDALFTHPVKSNAAFYKKPDLSEFEYIPVEHQKITSILANYFKQKSNRTFFIKEGRMYNAENAKREWKLIESEEPSTKRQKTSSIDIDSLKQKFLQFGTENLAEKKLRPDSFLSVFSTQRTATIIVEQDEQISKATQRR